MTRFLSIAALTAALLGGSWLAVPRAAPPSALGPGAVIEMHKQLFAALDRGDADAAREFVEGDRKATPRTSTMFLVDASGAPVKATDADESRDLLARLAGQAKSAGGTWATTLTSEAADCYSPELSYAVLELERSHTVGGKTEVRRYRSTSLVRYADKGWKIFHWHVSPADEPARAPASK